MFNYTHATLSYLEKDHYNNLKYIFLGFAWQLKLQILLHSEIERCVCFYKFAIVSEKRRAETAFLDFCKMCRR